MDASITRRVLGLSLVAGLPACAAAPHASALPETPALDARLAPLQRFVGRWRGTVAAGDLLSCFAKKEGKEGDPASPVGRRRTRPSGSDSCAGLPRPLLRCSAVQTGFLLSTGPLRKLSRVLAVDHLHFLSPLARRLEGSAGGKRAAHV